MADFPDDASPSAPAARRTITPLPPFVAPSSGGGVAPRVAQRVTSLSGGHMPPGRLYTPPGAPAISSAPATPVEVGELEVDEPAPAPESPLADTTAPADVPMRADAGEPADSTALADSSVFADSTALDVAPSGPPEVDAPESAEAEPAAFGASDDGCASAPTDEVETGADAEHPVAEADDDWFAVESSESDGPHEPAAPTPAFNDLRGIERLASDAAADGDGDEGAAYDAAGYDAPAGFAAAPEAPAPEPRTSVADVLERVALLVRDGQLTIPSDISASNDAAALAAVLTALLRTPRE